MLNKSILVCAHPDDEILWFSSILERVDQVLLCYLHCNSKPHWSIGRQESLSAHPVTTISCLGLKESEVFNGADWSEPEITYYGVAVSRKGKPETAYVKNYHILKDQLKPILIGHQNVFTHNPWGEYGNEEHVQIYRVIKELQREIGFTLWSSNYCSNRSLNLALKYINGFNSNYVTLQTNKELATLAKALYERNNCWTWFTDWEWFNEESFVEDSLLNEPMQLHGHIFPLNMMKFNHSEGSVRKPNRLARLVKKVLRP
jgi:hypothetical protein